jgi:hypothetical protein
MMLTSEPSSISSPMRQLKVHPALGEVSGEGWASSVGGLCPHTSHLDAELGDYMQYAEKRCRKIKSGRIPFSPKTSLWICQTQVYRSLLRFYAGRICNWGNLKQLAQRCNIPDAFSLSIQEIYFCLKACVNKCKYFRKNRK